MNHLDEGTIHAWLDGALNATQSAEIDAHVKSCAECSAKVAEARGLIAASSRILVSLDDTPANVIPRKAPVAPKRPRRIAPWVSGLAAAAILVTLWRTSGVEQPAPRSEINVPDINVVTGVPQPTLSEIQQPVTPPPPIVTVPPEAGQRQSRVANQALRDGRSAGAGASGASVGSVAAAQTAPAAAPVPSDLASSSVMDTASGEKLNRAREDVESRRRSVLMPAPTSIADMAKFAADSVTPWVGCYRLPALVGPLEAVIVTSVGEASTAARRSAGAPAPAARAPARATAAAVAPTAKAEDQAAFTVFRLDSVRGAQGFIVRDAVTGSQRGSWQQVSPDSVRLILPTGSRMVGNRSRTACPDQREEQ